MLVPNASRPSESLGDTHRFQILRSHTLGSVLPLSQVSSTLGVDGLQLGLDGKPLQSEAIWLGEKDVEVIIQGQNHDYENNEDSLCSSAQISHLPLHSHQNLMSPQAWDPLPCF